MNTSKGKSIFIADDNPDNLNVLSDILEAEGYNTRASLGGDEMLESIKLKKPDLIILDIHMPKIDGYETCTKLKESKETEHIPVIFCSALTEPFNIVKGFEVGGVDYITKPFRAKEVIARIRTHIELREKQLELENTLQYMKNAQNHLIQTEKMTSIAVLMAGIAHEINNPINYIINSVEGLKQDFSDVQKLLDFYTQVNDISEAGFHEKIQNMLNEIEYPVLKEEMAKLLEGIYDGALKVHDIAKSLKEFTSTDNDEKQIVSIVSELDRALLMIRHKADAKTKIRQNIKNSATSFIQPGRLSQVFLQLLENAFEAIEAKTEEGEKKIEINVETGSQKRPETIVSISDTGCGMQKEDIEQSYEPFYTTKQEGKGTGLGLTTAYQIVNDIGGTLNITSTPEKGTTVQVTLPMEAM